MGCGFGKRLAGLWRFGRDTRSQQRLFVFPFVRQARDTHLRHEFADGGVESVLAIVQQAPLVHALMRQFVDVQVVDQRHVQHGELHVSAGICIVAVIRGNSDVEAHQAHCNVPVLCLVNVAVTRLVHVYRSVLERIQLVGKFLI